MAISYSNFNIACGKSQHVFWMLAARAPLHFAKWMRNMSVEAPFSEYVVHIRALLEFKLTFFAPVGKPVAQNFKSTLT